MPNDDKTKTTTTTTVDQRSVEDIAASMAKVKKESKEVASVLNEQLKIITQLRDVMAEYTKNTEGAATGMNALSADKAGKVAKKVEEMNKSSKGTTTTIKTLGDKMKIFTKGSAIALGAVTGLYQGFKNLAALGKGAVSVIESISDALFSVAKSILAIPFKMMSALFNMATSGGGDNSLFEAIEKVREEFGSLRSESSRAVLDVAKTMGKLDNTGVSAFRIFGNLAQRIEAVLELAKGMGAAFEVFQEEIAHNGEAIMRYQRGLGITNEQMAGIASTALRMGKDVSKIQNEMTKQAMGMSKAFGVNAKVISKDMAKAMSDLAHFGHLSTKELGIAATFANKLGISIDKLTGIMDATATYDQTVESMSKLNEQFGLNIDHTEMMAAQNPAEKLEMLRKEFARTGKDMSSMDMHQRSLVRQATNLSDAELNAAFAIKNKGVALDKMNKQGDKNEKKTLSQTDAMKELADSIKRLTPPSGSQKPSIIDQIVDGFMRGLQSMPEFIKLMRNIRWILGESYLFGIKLGRMFGQLFPGVKDIIGGLADLFDPSHFRGAFNQIIKAFDVFKFKGVDGMSEFMDKLKEVFFNFFNKESGPGKKVIEGFKKFGETIVKIVLEVGKVAWQGLTVLYGKVIEELKNPSETTRAFMNFFVNLSRNISKFITKTFVPLATDIINSITSFIKDPKGIKSSMPSKSAVGQFMSDLFSPLWDAFMNMVKDPALQAAVTSFVYELGKFLMETLWEVFSALPWYAKLGVLAVAFGPAITRTLTMLASEALLRPGLNALGNAMSKHIATTLGKSVAEAAANKGVADAGVKAGQTLASGMQTGVEAGAKGSAGMISKFGKLLANPYVAAAAIAVAIIGGIVWTAHDYFMSESDKLKDKMEQEDYHKYQQDSKVSIEEKIKRIKEDQIKLSQGIEDAEGTGFVNWLRGTKGEKQGNMEAYLNERNADLERLSKEKEKADRAFMKGTVEYEKRIADEAKKKQLDALGPVTIENAADRFKKVDDLAKQMMSKNFNIKEKLAVIKEKIEAIGDFSIIDVKQEEQLNKTITTVESIRTLMASISSIGTHVENATTSLRKIDVVVIQDNLNKLNEALHIVSNSVAYKPGNMALNAFNATTELAAKNSERLTRLFEYFAPAVEKLLSIKEIMGKLTGKVDTKPISETLSAVFHISDMYAGFQLDTAGIKNVNAALIDINTGVERLAATHTSMAEAAKTVTGKSLKQTMTAVSDMIKKTQELDDSLAKMPKFSFPSRLSALADGMGMGGNFAYTVKSKNVVIQMSIEVKMSAAEVEEVIVHRTNSIIRDRLNFALGDGSGDDKIQSGRSLSAVPGNVQMIAATVT